MNIRILVALIACITVSVAQAMNRDNFFTMPRTRFTIRHDRPVSISSIIDGIEYAFGSPEAVLARMMYDQRVMRVRLVRELEITRRNIEKIEQEIARAEREKQQLEISGRALLSLTNNVVPEGLSSPEPSECSSSPSNRENPRRKNANN